MEYEDYKYVYNDFKFFLKPRKDERKGNGRGVKAVEDQNTHPRGQKGRGRPQRTKAK